MNKQLLEAAEKIIKWYDDKDESNPHSTDQWKEAYDELRTAVNNFSSNPLLEDEICLCTGKLELEKVNDIVWCCKCRRRFV